MRHAILPALMGLVALAYAAQAARAGRVILRDMPFARRDRPAAFWMAVALYGGAGLLGLMGAAWIVHLSASGDGQADMP